MRGPSALSAESLSCSFCHKSQDSVSKLISSPSDDPKAYICDECITVCATIIEDERGSAEVNEGNREPADEPHPLLGHPLASQLLTAAELWVQQESLGMDAAEELAEVRDIAIRLLRVPNQLR